MGHTSIFSTGSTSMALAPAFFRLSRVFPEHVLATHGMHRHPIRVAFQRNDGR